MITLGHVIGQERWEAALSPAIAAALLGGIAEG
jgi:hypothetical protein